jgi:ABC-type iron transport system FetAB permease component
VNVPPASRGSALLLVVVVAYVAAVLALVVTRFVLQWPNEGQVAASLIALVAVLLGAVLLDRRWAGRKRTGWQAVANAVILFFTIFVSQALYRALPNDYPLAIIGLVMPVLLAAEVAVDLLGSS